MVCGSRWLAVTGVSVSSEVGDGPFCWVGAAVFAHDVRKLMDQCLCRLSVAEVVSNGDSALDEPGDSVGGPAVGTIDGEAGVVELLLDGVPQAVRGFAVELDGGDFG